MQWIWLSLILPMLANAQLPNFIHKLEVHGHRGARAREPENTLPAFEYALRAGVDVLEADLNVTRDGKLVVNHDQHVNTDLCQSDLSSLRRQIRPLIYSLTLAQLRHYDCGSKHDPNFPKRKLRPGASLISLGDLLSWLERSGLAGARTVRLNLETKIDPKHPEWSVSPSVFVELIIGELRRHRFPLNRVILQSFDFRTIVYAKKRYPQWETSALVDQEGRHDRLDVAAIYHATHADYLSPNAKMISSSKVREAHSFGMKVIPWTLNSRFTWWYFRRMGIDGIITDDPARLIDYLE